MTGATFALVAFDTPHPADVPIQSSLSIMTPFTPSAPGRVHGVVRVTLTNLSRQYPAKAGPRCGFDS